MRNEVVGFEPIYNPVKHEFVEEEEMLEEIKINEDTITIKEKPKRARINPDSIPVLFSAVAMVGLLMVSSFAVSFSGIYAVSAWTGLPVYLQWLPALFIDAAILAYTISLIVFKARGESTWKTTLGLVGFAAISVVANASHTLFFWDGTLGDFRSWMGVIITASAPIAVLLASEEITRLAFENKE